MTDYQIEANTRRCAVTGRELTVGERFYSVLVEEEGKLQRKDYCSEAWQGAPAGAFSFWSGRIPAGYQTRAPRIDEDSLVDCFERLEHETEPGRVRFRYIVALLLMRRKRFKFDQISSHEGQDFLCVRCARTGSLYRVLDPRLSEEEMCTVQEEVLQALGWR